MTSPTPDRDPNVWTSPFEELLAQSADSSARDHPGTEVHHPNPTFGTPNEDKAFWQGKQHLSDDCAIKCQQFILEQFQGHGFSEDTLVREATEHGWYAPGHGTKFAHIGNLLELHGVAVTHYDHASQFHLAQELAQGHKVIAVVESDSLWNHNPIFEALRDVLGIHGTADHAVVVSGIDTSDPQHVQVLVSDPGNGDALAKYPMEQFLEAWHGSNFLMIATHDPAPAHLPEMAHFNYSAGHIAEVAGMPYDQFLEYADHPQAFTDVIHQFMETNHHADGQHTLHDPAISAQPWEHAEHQDATDVHHDPIPDSHHHDACRGHMDPTDHLPDGHSHHHLS